MATYSNTADPISKGTKLNSPVPPAEGEVLEPQDQNTLPQISAELKVGSEEYGFGELKEREEDKADLLKKAALRLTKVSFFSLLRFASCRDYFFMFIGILLALVSSILLPVVLYTNGLLYRCLQAKVHSCPGHREEKGYLCLIYSTILFGFTSFAYNFCFVQATSRQINDIKMTYLASLMRKDYSWLDTNLDRNLALRQINDCLEIRHGLQNFPKILFGLTTSALLFIMTTYINYKLAFLALFLTGISVLISFWKVSFEYKLVENEQKAYEAQVNDLAIKILSNIQAVWCFNAEKEELAAYRSVLVSPCSLARTVILAAIFGGLSWYVTMCSWVVLICISVLELEISENSHYDDGPDCPPNRNQHFQLTRIGEGIVIATCFPFATFYLSGLPFLIRKIRKAQRIAAEVFFAIDCFNLIMGHFGSSQTILHVVPIGSGNYQLYIHGNKAKNIAFSLRGSNIDNLSDSGITPPQNTSKGTIRMSHVSFSYPRKSLLNIVDSLSLTINRGEMVTILGASGCGKSTLFKLLLRFYDVTAGKITLDGSDIREYNVQWYRSQFGLISRDLKLFNATIEQNLRYSVPDATYHTMVDACIKAGAHVDIISLPNGYQTVVGSKSNVNLREVTIKKILLARILLQQPPIFLLDLDLVSEADGQDFQQFLLSLLISLKGKHTIVLTMSKFNSIVMSSDVIFVMKNGKVIETGNHNSLLHKKNAYFKIVQHTTENTMSLKPYVRSQLSNFKFAQFLQRKHNYDDKMHEINYESYITDKAILGSVYLRHSFEDQHRPIEPRIIGGFHYLTAYYFETDIYYLKQLVRSCLLHRRDFRHKMMQKETIQMSIESEGRKSRAGNSIKSKRLGLALISDFAGIGLTTSTGTGALPIQIESSSITSRDPDTDNRYRIGKLDSPRREYSVITVGSGPSIDKDATNSSSSSAGSSLSETGSSSKLGIITGNYETPEQVDWMARKYKRRATKIRFIDPVPTSYDVNRPPSTVDIRKFTTKRKSQAKFLSYLGTLDAQSGGASGSPSDCGGPFLKYISAMEQRLKNYFGWTVNASADDSSISSDDSIAFWNEYNLNLQVALARKGSTATAIFSLVKFSWPFLLLVMGTSAFMGASVVLVHYEIAVILKHALNFENEELVQRCYYVCYFSAIPAVTAFMQEIIAGFGCYWANNRMRVFLFDSYLREQTGWFDYPENDISILCDSLKTDTANLQKAIVTLMTVTSQSLLMIVLAYHYLSQTKGFRRELYWISACIPLFILIRCFCDRLKTRYSIYYVQTLEGGPQVVFDMIANIRTVIALQLEKHFLKEGYRTLVASQKICCNIDQLNCLAYGLTQCGFALPFSIWLAIAHTTLTTSYSAQIFDFVIIGEIACHSTRCIGRALATLPSYAEIKEFSAIMATAKESFELSKLQNTLHLFASQREDPPPSIRFQDAKFAYPLFPHSWVLKGITLNIQPGQYVAVVGPVLSGKSTMLNLIQNMWSITKGSILLNETDYKELKSSCIRKIVGCVELDSVFMPQRTIAQNIAYGDLSREVKPPEIEEAAKLSQIHTTIMSMEHGYETKLEDLPETPATFVFRQKLAIAREWIHNPKILLVNESTFSLDHGSSRCILGSLMKLRVGRTFVVASRRIEPIRNADVIVVLRDGLVVEMGTDAELLAVNGTYYQLFMGQTLYETTDDYNLDPE